MTAGDPEARTRGRSGGRPGTRAARFAAQFVIYAALTSAFLQLDLFGIDTKLDRHSSDIINLVAGPFYPVAGRSQMSVVVLDEVTVRARRTTTRPKLSLHAEVLYWIRQFRPKAVMLDMYFIDPRVDDKTMPLLLGEIEEYADAGIPLYLVAPPAGSESLPEIDELVRRKGDGVRFVPGPFGTDDDHVDRSYLVKAPLDGPPVYTASFRIYHSLFAPALGEIDPAGRDDDRMALFWGTQAEWTNARWQEDCANVVSNPLTRLRKAVFDPVALRKTCFYTPTIPTAELLTAEDDNDPDVPHLIRDRVVFYGTYLRGSQDVAVSPAHGRLPGVMLHAMALDNLISFEGRYLGDRLADIGGLRLTGTHLEHLLAWLLVALVLAYRWLRTSWPEADNLGWTLTRYWLDISLVGLVAVLVSGVALFALAAFQLAPINWIGLFGLFALVGLLSRFEVLEKIGAALPGWLGRWFPTAP